MKRHIMLGTTAIISFLMSASICTADIPDPILYNLVAVHSSKCLDIPGDSYNAGVQAQQWDCNGGGAQKFRLNALYTGNVLRYHIDKATHAAITLKQAGTQNGAAVVTADAVNDINREWYLAPATDGKWNFVNLNSNKCLDISGGNNGAPAQIYTCTGNTNQQFYLEPVGGHVKFTAVHSGKCLDIESSSYANGARVEQNICNGGWTQQWKILPGPNAKFFFINRGTGKIMDLTQGSINNGTALQQYSFIWNNNQIFSMTAGSPYTGFYPRLPNGQQPYNLTYHGGNQKVFDIEGASQAAGANLQLWDLLVSPAGNQQFTISQ